MAVTKTILKNTNQETVIKVAGTAGSANIDLQTDLVAAQQEVAGDTQVVNIITTKWVGLSGSSVVIARNGVNVVSMNAGDSGELLLGAGYSDTVENTSDLVVTIAGAEAQCYITLRKVSGYATKVETAQFGSYDNPSVVGS